MAQRNVYSRPTIQNARGIDEYYGFCSGLTGGTIIHPCWNTMVKLSKARGFVIDDFTANHAMEYIEENQNQPFFVYLPYCTPHLPMQVLIHGGSFMENDSAKSPRDQPGGLPHARAALAMCENID